MSVEIKLDGLIVHDADPLALNEDLSCDNLFIETAINCDHIEVSLLNLLIDNYTNFRVKY